MEVREKGKVKWFNVSMGYGIITRDAGGDVYVHYSAIRGRGSKSLTAGQAVEYALVEGKNGPEARDVHAQQEGDRDEEPPSEVAS
jgi:CspA family cold shock protein